MYVIMKEKIIKDKRLLNWLKEKGIETQEDLRSFLNPSYYDLNNPFGLNGIKEATSEIKKGIAENKKFVIVGDYDCDGIMASTVVYRYLISENANVEVFIPNRFEDGYGLNCDLIDEIMAKANPDIVITVDLGITCIKEVEYLKNKGVSVIVTDHHEPQEILPDCIVIDPKIKQNYACDFLCGTGVAFKLVSALAGNEFANKLLDIVAIATIGDIVPLLKENRAIASLGLEKISKKEFSLESVKYLFETLKIDNVSSSDIYLKIVPKINASGRMDNAKKVFDFLNTSDKNQMQKLLADILADNNLRLNEINKSIEKIEKELEKIDIINNPIICVRGDYHQGILGILASRITGDYGKPAIVFARTNNGTFKASGRSVDGVDLHGIILENSGLCEHFGGHKMAVGLEIAEDKFEAFTNAILSSFRKRYSSDSVFVKTCNNAIEIFEEDINKNFITELNMLAPFGCANEKPTFVIRTNRAIKFASLGAKSSPHLKLNLGKNGNIVYFNGLPHKEVLLAVAKKELVVELDFNYYKNNATAQAIVKKLRLLEPAVVANKNAYICSSVASLAKTLTGRNLQKGKVKYISSLNEIVNENSRFGTAIFAFTKDDLNSLHAIDYSQFVIADEPPSNLQNVIVVSATVPTDFAGFKKYKNLVFLSDCFDNQFDYLADNFNVFVVRNNAHIDIKIEDIRKKCALVYSLIKEEKIETQFASLMECCDKIHAFIPHISVIDICVCLFGLNELGIISLDNNNECLIKALSNSSKKNLDDSLILQYFRRS